MAIFVAASGGRAVANQRGMILFSSLLLLGLLMAVGIGALVSVQNNYRIAANLKMGSNAFYLAEAGIEWGKSEISKAVVHPPASVESTIKFSGGTFSVATLDSIKLSPVVATSVIRSMGKLGASSQTIQAQLTKHYDLADAAITARGNLGRAVFLGNSFLLSGSDHDPATGQAVPSDKARPAISVSDEAARLRIEEGLTNSQRSNLVGNKAGAISVSETVPNDAISRLADDLCSAPGAVVTAIPSEGTLVIGSDSWGNRSAPQVRCVDGLSAAGDSLIVNGGLSGAGILVVRNAEMVLNGAFDWEGPVLLSGRAVALKVFGEENKQIIGSLLINEVGPYSETNPPFLELAGAVRILFSRSSLAKAAVLVPGATLAEMYTSLPSEIIQNYWRAVTP